MSLNWYPAIFRMRFWSQTSHILSVRVVLSHFIQEGRDFCPKAFIGAVAGRLLRVAPRSLNATEKECPEPLFGPPVLPLLHE